MIKEIKGDLLDFPDGISIILHQTNVNKAMGSGIAKQIADRWPKVVEMDKGYNWKLGEAAFTCVGEGTVANIYAQELRKDSLTGSPTSYDAAYKALKKCKETISKVFGENDNSSIKLGLPKYMGCALGGGDWTIYRAIIEAVFADAPYDVVIVEWDKNGQSGDNSED